MLRRSIMTNRKKTKSEDYVYISLNQKTMPKTWAKIEEKANELGDVTFEDIQEMIKKLDK